MDKIELLAKALWTADQIYDDEDDEDIDDDIDDDCEDDDDDEEETWETADKAYWIHLATEVIDAVK